MDKQPIAPEVKAAWQAAPTGGHPIDALQQTVLTGDVTLADLVAEMVRADRIDILGVLPRVLGEALLTTTLDQVPRRSAARLTYFTPRRERVLAYRHEKVMGQVIQRWNIGLVCFRNWAERSSADAQMLVSDVYPIDDLFLECVVIIYSSGQARVFTLVVLPQYGWPSTADLHTVDKVIVTEVSDNASMSNVEDLVKAIRSASRPTATRRLICTNGAATSASAPGDLPNEFVPQLDGFVYDGSTEPATAVVPTAVVALYAESPKGPGLLLKHRTILNSHIDIDTLALLSERVAEEDLAISVKKDVPDHVPDEEVLDHWWLVMDKPSPILLPYEAFVEAGQREVFVLTGLDIAADRFEYCGSLVIEHEVLGYHLGFFGLRVVLRRTNELDEFRRALSWNADLHFVAAKDLYRASSAASRTTQGLRLNRLLSRRRDWVTDVLLATPKG